MNKFTFYDYYYDAMKLLTDEEAGRFIKRICNYALFDREDTPSKDERANVIWISIFQLLEEVKALEQAKSSPSHYNRRMKHFTFYDSYGKTLDLISDNKCAGMLAKAMCEYMLYDNVVEIPDQKTADYFTFIRKQLDLSKLRAGIGSRGGSNKNKLPVYTLEKIRADFPALRGNLSPNHPILQGVDMKDLYDYIFLSYDEREIKSIYTTVQKYREDKGLNKNIPTS